MRLLIKNGRVIDPQSGIDNVLDILVEEGRVRGMAPGIAAEDALIIPASGKLVTPGLIDLHVHFRQPGKQEYKETIRTGSRAAARGGFTTVVCMPNTVPPIDSGRRVKRVLELARADSLVNVYTMAAISRGLRGRELVNVREVVEAGAVGLTDDGFPVVDINLMSRAAREARKYNLPLCPHCEESRLRGRREALTRARLASEARYIERDLHLMRESGCRFHFLHVSLARSVKLIAAAKEKGLPVTAEATPHHLTLTREEARQIGPDAKVNPPLRTGRDVAALREALREGVIDVIASDHAPHAPYEKAGPNPPSGVIGLETTLGVVLTELVWPGVLSLRSAIEKLTINPARVLGLEKGRLQIGLPADITIIDPEREWVVDPEEFESKGRNCPFAGWRLKGKAVMTIVEGRVVMAEGRIVEEEAPQMLRQLRLPLDK